MGNMKHSLHVRYLWMFKRTDAIKLPNIPASARLY